MCCPSDLEAKMGQNGVMGCCAITSDDNAPIARACMKLCRETWGLMEGFRKQLVGDSDLLGFMTRRARTRPPPALEDSP